MDRQPLHALSGIPQRAWRGGRIQRQVHVRPDGAARRFVCHAPRPRARQLSQLLPSPSALAVQRPAPREGQTMISIESTAALLDTADSEFGRDVLLGLSQPQKQVPCRWLYDHRGSALFEDITSL